MTIEEIYKNALEKIGFVPEDIDEDKAVCMMPSEFREALKHAQEAERERCVQICLDAPYRCEIESTWGDPVPAAVDWTQSPLAPELSAKLKTIRRNDCGARNW